jgi:5-carboxymethyl-2-hydroxymuconate isomerase
MVHVVIEYSANLAEVVDIQELVDIVHSAALTDGLAAAAGLRTRAVARDQYRIADGRPEFGFVAVVARIGPGRASADKAEFRINRNYVSTAMSETS